MKICWTGPTKTFLDAILGEEFFEKSIFGLKTGSESAEKSFFRRSFVLDGNEEYYNKA